MTWPILLLLVVTLSLYDLLTGKVPNEVTLPLLGTGILVHFPGTTDIWLACLVVFIAWYLSWMAAGDAKLWMAVFWTLPAMSTGTIPIMLFGTLFITALLQFAWRKFKRQPLTGFRSPGAWRTIPFILWSLHVH